MSSTKSARSVLFLVRVAAVFVLLLAIMWGSPYLDPAAKVQPPPSPADGLVSEATLEVVLRAQLTPGALIVDVRAPDLFAAGRIQGAINAEPRRADAIEHLRGSLAAAPIVIIYGDPADPLSLQHFATALAVAAGRHVSVYHEGWPQWHSLHLPAT